MTKPYLSDLCNPRGASRLIIARLLEFGLQVRQRPSVSRLRESQRGFSGLFTLWWMFENLPYRESLIPAIFLFPIISGLCNLPENSENQQKYKKMLPQIVMCNLVVLDAPFIKMFWISDRGNTESCLSSEMEDKKELGSSLGSLLIQCSFNGKAHHPRFSYHFPRIANALSFTKSTRPWNSLVDGEKRGLGAPCGCSFIHRLHSCHLAVSNAWSPAQREECFETRSNLQPGGLGTYSGCFHGENRHWNLRPFCWTPHLGCK